MEAEEGCNYFQMSIRYGTTSPTFNILISQIACSASFKAPDGCFQFFTGTTGTISSFNIDGGTHLADLKYTICIRWSIFLLTLKQGYSSCMIVVIRKNIILKLPHFWILNKELQERKFQMQAKPQTKYISVFSCWEV